MTQDIIGRPFPLVTVPVGELGDGSLHAPGPRLPILTMAAQKGSKNTGVLAGVADCGRSRKRGCRRRLALGLKPKHGSHAEGEPHSFGAPFATQFRKLESKM